MMMTDHFDLHGVASVYVERAEYKLGDVTTYEIGVLVTFSDGRKLDMALMSGEPISLRGLE